MFALSEMLPASPLLEIAAGAFADVLDAVEILDAAVVVTPASVTTVLDPSLHAGLADEDVEDPEAEAADDYTLADVDLAALPPALDGGPPVDSPGSPYPETALGLHVDARVFDPLVIPIPGFSLASLVLDTQDVVAEITVRADGYQIALEAVLRVRVDGTVLRPMRAVTRADGAIAYERDESRPHAEIVVAAARVTLDSSGSVGVDLGVGARFETPVMIGDTGVVVDAEDIALVLGAEPVLQVGRARVMLPPDLPLEGVVVGLEQARLNARGFSGAVSVDLPLAFDDTAGRFEYRPAEAGGEARPATLFGLSGGLRHLALAFEHGALTGSDIAGAVLIPYFDEPVDVRIAIGPAGDLAVTLSAADPDGITLRKEELLALTLRSLTVAKEGDVGLVRATGGLAPLVMSGDGLQWPRLDVTDLEIDTLGRFRIREAWLELENLATLDLFGFHFELARIGLGYEEPQGEEPAGRLWVDLSGSLRLIEQIPVGLAVEGFRLSWPENLDAIVDLDGPPTVERALAVLGALRVQFEGIHLFFGVPDAVEFEGLIRFFKEPSAVGFAGDVALRVPASGFALEAGLLVGMSFEPPPFPFLYVYFGVELPAGIPLGQSGLALKGAKGLFGLNVSPAKAPEANWFHDWYKLPPEGAHPTPKWGVERTALALGAGLTVTTADGYVKGVRGLLVLSLPGPILVIEGKALILSALASGEPPFGALAIFDGPQRTVQFNIEAQAELVEDMLEAHGGLEAFFDFVDLTNWHLYLGEDAPADRRVQANILKLPESDRYLFDASAYLMLDMVGEHTLRSRLGFLVGLGERYDEYDPFVISLDASIRGDGEVTVFPEQLSGEVELEAAVEISAFGVGVQLAASAAVLAEAPEPFRIEATLTVTADMPDPAEDFETELPFLWEAPPRPTPVAPLVGVVVDSDLSPRGGAIELAGGDILRAEDDRSGIDVAARLEAEEDRLAESAARTRAEASPPVPLDARPTLLFGHDMNDDTGAEFGRDPDGAEHAHHIGRLRLEPRLSAVALYAHDKAEPWTGDFAADWQLVASSRPATGTERLWGIWLADGVPDDPGAPAVRRLRLWTANPFVHARRSLGTGYQTILGLPGPRLGYPEGFVRDHPDYFRCRPIELISVCVDFADAAKPPAEGAPGPDGVVPAPVFVHEGLTLTAVASLRAGTDGRQCLAVRGKLHIRFRRPVVEARIDFGDDPRLEALAARGRVTASRAPAGAPDAPCAAAVPFELEVDGRIWIIAAPEGLDCLELVRPAPVAEICFVTREEAARSDRAEEQCARNADAVAHLREAPPMLEPGRYYRLIVKTLAETELVPAPATNPVKELLDDLYQLALGELGGVNGFLQEAFFQTEAPPSSLDPYVKWSSPERQATRVFRDDDLLVRFRRSYVEALYEQTPHHLAVTVRDTRGRAIDGYAAQWRRAGSATLLPDEEFWETRLADPPAWPRDDVLAAARPVLLAAEFETHRLAPEWEALIQDGVPDGAADWEAGGGELRGPAGVGGGPIDRRDPAKPGPMLVWREAVPRDMAFTVEARSAGGDAIGVVFGLGDARSFYRFSMDDRLRYRRLVKVKNGFATVLRETADGYDRGDWHEIEVVMTAHGAGLHITVAVDGAAWADTREDDAPPHGGRVGLYCWRAAAARFARLRVRAAADLTPPLGSRQRYELVVSNPADSAFVPYRIPFVTSAYARFRDLVLSFSGTASRVACAPLPADKVRAALQATGAFADARQTWERGRALFRDELLDRAGLEARALGLRDARAALAEAVRTLGAADGSPMLGPSVTTFSVVALSIPDAPSDASLTGFWLRSPESLDLRYASAAASVGRTLLELSRFDPARGRWDPVALVQVADADGAEALLVPAGIADGAGPTALGAGRYRLVLEYRRNLGDEAGGGAHRFDRPVPTRLGIDAPERVWVNWTV